MNLLLTNVSREAGLGMGARNAELNSIKGHEVNVQYGPATGMARAF